MDKFRLAEQNLGRVFNSGRVCISSVCSYIKTAKLIVENSARSTLRLIPLKFALPLCRNKLEHL